MPKTLIFFGLALVLVCSAALIGFTAPIDPTLQNEVKAVIQANPIGKKPTRADLDNFKERAVQLHNKISATGDVLTTLSFTEPLASADLLDLLEKHDVQAKLVYVYAKENSQDGYVSGAIAVKTDIPFKKRPELDTLLYEAEEKDPIELDTTFLGFIAVVGFVPGKQIAAIQADEQVYLADVSVDRQFGFNPNNKGKAHHVGDLLYHINQDEAS